MLKLIVDSFNKWVDNRCKCDCKFPGGKGCNHKFEYILKALKERTEALNDIQYAKECAIKELELNWNRLDLLDRTDWDNMNRSDFYKRTFLIKVLRERGFYWYE